MNVTKTLKASVAPSVAECLARFGLGFMASFAVVFGDISPFAVAIAAGVDSAVGCIFALLGAAAGYMLGSDMMTALRYIGTALLIAGASRVFLPLEQRGRSWFMPLTAGVMCLCVGFVFSFDGGIKAVKLLHLAADVTICAVCTYFFRLALSPWNGRLNFEYSSEVGHTVGVMLLAGTLMLALSRIELFGVLSIGRACAAFAVLIFAYKGGAGTGCAAGAALGVVMDAGVGGGLYFCAAYCIGGLAAGTVLKLRRWVSAAAFTVTGGIICAAFGHSPAPLFEAMLATVGFMVIPNKSMSRIGALIGTKNTGHGSQKSREYICERMDMASLAFHDLYETVKSAAGSQEDDEDLAVVFDRAAAAVCLSCERTTECWFKQYDETKASLNCAVPMLTENGRINEHDLPQRFSDGCLHYPGFVASINSEMQAMTYRRQYRSRLHTNQSAAFNQYAEIANILGEFSNELYETGDGEVFLENRLNKYFLSEGIQSVAAAFKDKGGRIHLEICGGAQEIVKNPHWLDKLSAAAGIRLCTAQKADRGDNISLLEAEPLAAAVGIASVKKKSGEACGDKGAYFKTDEGMLYVILSDGMGCGNAAAKYSGDAVRILERLLRAGVMAETAVKMLNDLMLLKNEDDIGTATVDLLGIDLFSGQTHLYKYGAAPSYIVKDGHVRKISGTGFATGLGETQKTTPDKVKLTLSPGCAAVLVSDGVVEQGDEWLCKLLKSTTDMETLARQIVKTAASSTGVNDDMTAYVICVKQRG